MNINECLQLFIALSCPVLWDSLLRPEHTRDGADGRRVSAVLDGHGDREGTQLGRLGKLLWAGGDGGRKEAQRWHGCKQDQRVIIS